MLLLDSEEEKKNIYIYKELKTLQSGAFVLEIIVTEMLLTNKKDQMVKRRLFSVINCNVQH